jgi:hypothetical protein
MKALFASADPLARILDLAEDAIVVGEVDHRREHRLLACRLHAQLEQRGNGQPSKIVSPSGYLFNYLHDGYQVCIQRTLNMIASRAAAFDLLGAGAADILADGLDIVADVSAIHGLDSLYDQRKESEEGARRRIFSTAVAFDITIGANPANPILENRLDCE